MTAAIAATTGLFAKKVKFQVDMTGKTISSNGVHIAGNFQKAAGASDNWKPGETPLSNGGSGNIYSVVVDIPAKAVYEFKFINDNNWGLGEEVIPAISKVESAANGGNNGNRWIYIDSLANDTTVLAAILFAGSAPANKIALRFAVDLQKETAINTLGVYVAGDFQGSNGASGNWKPNETRMVNLFGSNKVYEYIAYVGNTDTVQFKYLNGNDWPQNESVPSGCATGGNRTFQAASVATALAKVCFGSCTACPAAAIPTYSYTFKVDMSNSDCDGGFDSVTVSGAGAKLTGFGAGLKMAQVGSTGVYELTVNNLDSGELNFKYRFHKNNSTNWEGGDNRITPLTKNDVANVTCFGSRVVGNCPSKPAPSKITFIADFTGAGAPAPANKVYIIGDFTKPQFQAGAIELVQLVGKPGVYSATVDSICPGKISFKIVNGDVANTANEENFPDTNQRGCVEANGVGGFNRTFVRTVATPVIISYQFNTCTRGFIPTFSLVSPANNARVVVERGNTTPVVITWNRYNAGNTYKWKATPKGGSLAAALLSVPSDSNGFKNQLTLTSGAIDTILGSAAVQQGDSIELVWSVFAYKSASDSVKAEQTFTIKLLRKVTVGVSEITVNNFKLYPNPTNEFSILAFNDNAKNHDVNIFDIAGKVVRSYSNHELSTLKIERNELKAGIYFVNIRNDRNQNITLKLMIQE